MVLKRFVFNPLLELARQGKLAGVLLIAATVVSLVLSNGAWAGPYLRFWETEIGLPGFGKSVIHWINDGLMVFFFLLVGLEIKRELVDGELSSVKQAILPLVAAAGGMLVPGVIYLFCNLGSPESLRGWAIPTATDIAFSLGVLSLLGKRVPVSLKIFLAALAIIDDIGAILIIALFYSNGIHLAMLASAAAIFLVMIAMNRIQVTRVVWYIVPGMILWYFILKSGIHPTIAGVLIALTIPVEPGKRLEHRLTRPVNYFILPVFALSNTAIPISLGLAGASIPTVSVGIILGLFIGKPLGITLFSYLPRILNISRGPSGLTLRMIIGMGFTAGIGFTMSIFISSLAFHDAATNNIAKLSIIAGSLISAISGLIILSTCRVPHVEESS
jgi:Na+:H+ antiporter, NhaA family